MEFTILVVDKTDETEYNVFTQTIYPVVFICNFYSFNLPTNKETP